MKSDLAGASPVPQKIIGEEKLIEYGSNNHLNKEQPMIRKAIIGYIITHSKMNLTENDYNNIVRKKIWDLKKNKNSSVDEEEKKKESQQRATKNRIKKSNGELKNSEIVPLQKHHTDTSKNVGAELPAVNLGSETMHTKEIPMDIVPPTANLRAITNADRAASGISTVPIIPSLKI
ncbi:hypothetical protein PV328_003980 [Microctonus aethiopoides]|uniref:Uncharacterized protein n=1 Tax=Microctonus aethiopoides TaxID=144406 RepID=A0AA39KL33_9HYME|nr:hypothetical protein PV328_003980 [Microctonus aethiopoides]